MLSNFKQKSTQSSHTAPATRWATGSNWLSVHIEVRLLKQLACLYFNFNFTKFNQMFLTANPTVKLALEAPSTTLYPAIPSA